jgi:pimeloyl-ACP methyl ester carboxylesterase
MMFPTLRGGNSNPGRKEYFLGEVEDVLAAAERLAQLPYVDPARVYLGGHSSGGTLALLVAASGGRFASVFALGPAARIDEYARSIMPVSLDRRDSQEGRLRSPVLWMGGITSPTYVIEGTVVPSNRGSFDELCAAAKANRRVACVAVAGEDHFSVIARVTKVIAARVAVPSGSEWILRPGEFGPAEATPALRP